MFSEQPRQPVIGLSLSAALGILCADVFPIRPLPCVFALVVFAAVLLRWRSTAGVCAFVACGFFVLHLFTNSNNGGEALSRKWASGSRTVSATGVVVTEPEERPSSRGVPRCDFQVRLESLALNDSTHPCASKALVHWRGTPPRYGDRIAFCGDARNISPTRNPGQFDYTSYLHRLGIYSEISLRYANDGTIVSSGHGNPIMSFAFVARDWMQRQLALGIDDSPEISGLIQSMVLGLKEQTPEETRELFQRTGTLHLFVVNGLHVGMFATIAWLLLRPTQIGRRRSVFVIIPLLAFYALVTGLSPGSIRATLMAAIVLGGLFVEREPFSFNNLAVAAFVLLAWNTNELFMPGFQFSFGVVFTIILLAGRFQRFFARFGQPDPFLPRALWSPVQHGTSLCSKGVASLVGVSTAAWMGSLPFTLTYLNLITPNTVATNLFAVPMAFIILANGMLSMLSNVWTALASIFNNTNWLVAHAILAVVQLFARLPGGHVFVELPKFKPSPVCEITVFDLGAGGAAHLRVEGRDWLIDSGSDFNYGNVVRPYLHTRGVNRLDGFALTHGDAAHIGGAVRVLDDFSPRMIVESPLRDRSRTRNAFAAELNNREIGKSICEAGDQLPISTAAKFRVLYPPPALAANVADDRTLVLQLDADGVRVLFVSDSGFVTERWLLDHAVDLKSKILVMGHHGSDISGTPDFLAAVQPDVIVATAADFPSAERIPEDWARDVASRGIRLFRQDRTGAVHIEIHRDEFVVRSFLGSQIFRKSRR